MLQPIVICGRNVLLREVRDSDAGTLFETYFGSVEAAHFLSRSAHTSVAQTQASLDRMCLWDGYASKPNFGWVIARRCDDQPVGIFYAMTRECVAEIHYGIGTPFRNFGFATEAGKLASDWLLRQRGMHRVWTAVDPENLATVRVLEKMNFEKECMLKSWVVLPAFGDEPRDAASYRFLKQQAHSAPEG